MTFVTNQVCTQEPESEQGPDKVNAYGSGGSSSKGEEAWGKGVEKNPSVFSLT